MRRLRITVFDLVAKGAARKLFQRAMNPNYASIMPQVIAVWCEQAGHDVRHVCYTGAEDLERELPSDTDVLIVSSYTRSALAAYAISRIARDHGAITVLGGPHARCYPQHAARYFDYVLGFTDKSVIDDVLSDCEAHRPTGIHLSAAGQPPELPGVRERWKFIEPTIAKAPLLKIVPMIGSMGCPYQCSFCIDSQVDYQPLAFDRLRDDLRFLRTKMKRPCVGWHDPLFGVRFNEYMGAIEEAVPPGSIDFLAEISLSLLSEAHVKRLSRNGFKALLPGVESWYEFGNKAKTRRETGEDKVRQVAAQVNMILRHVPYVQTNFVLGLDCDAGAEPFELTKRFIDLTPGAWPAFSLLTAYGRAAPLNLEFQRDGRVIPLPFNFLDTHWMNVKPKHYAWDEFYAHSADLAHYALSYGQIARRFRANRGVIPRVFNAARALSTGRIRQQATVARMMRDDPAFRAFYEGETSELPPHLALKTRNSLGTLWDALPGGALEHDQNAYLKASQERDTGLPPEGAAARG